MDLNLGAIFEGFDFAALLQGLIKLVTDLIGGLGA